VSGSSQISKLRVEKRAAVAAFLLVLLLAGLPFFLSAGTSGPSHLQTAKAASNEIGAELPLPKPSLSQAITIQTQISLQVLPSSVAPGEVVSFIVAVSPSPPTENDVFSNLTLLVYRPDGTVDLLGPFSSDPNGSKTVTYKTEMLGGYVTRAIYDGQLFVSLNATYLGAESPTVTLTVNTNSGGQLPDESMLPTASPTMTLFGGGARWAAGNGTSALYVNWFDSYTAHYLSGWPDWNTTWWQKDDLEEMKKNTVNELSRRGFEVECVGDVPQDISKYDLVIFEAWWAVEPKHSQLVREYLTNGGNVVVLQGVPSYFSVYCKDWWPYRFGGIGLSPLSDWFGSSTFANTGGSARAAVTHPFETSLTTEDVLISGVGGSCYSVVRSSLSNDSHVIALWNDGLVFAFTHEYGKGRVYYQAVA
jgi:hypothetical protein